MADVDILWAFHNSDPTKQGTVETVDEDTAKVLIAEGRAILALPEAVAAAKVQNLVAGDDVGDPVPLPAKSAPKGEWSLYASDHGVALGPDATKADIIAALEAAGVPTA